MIHAKCVRINQKNAKSVLIINICIQIKHANNVQKKMLYTFQVETV